MSCLRFKSKFKANPNVRHCVILFKIVAFINISSRFVIFD